MKKLTAIIVEDEVKARNILQQLLNEHCPQVEIKALCANVPEAVKAINEHQPDIIFLDVDMPVYSGFQLLDFFPEINFKIIFITAFSEYAIQAFRVSAVDFLLKPVDIDLLIEAVEKATGLHAKDTYSKQLGLLRNNAPNKVPETIAIASNDSIDFIKTAEVLYLKAERAYTKIYLENGNELLASKNIKEFEDMLTANSSFMRIHRSYIINLQHAKKLLKSEGGSVEMKNGDLIAISKEAKDGFIERMVSF